MKRFAIDFSNREEFAEDCSKGIKTVKEGMERDSSEWLEGPNRKKAQQQQTNRCDRSYQQKC